MMEFDFSNQCSKETIDLITSGEDPDVHVNFLVEDNQGTICEAKTVYILLPKNIPTSRATRLHWLLDHLNKVILLHRTINSESRDLEVISVIPREQNVQNSPSNKCTCFIVTNRTEVRFVAHAYKFVYCLDMSPSQSIIDIDKGVILYDELLKSFKSSIEGLCRKFTIPGSNFEFQPILHLTVMVNTPFLYTPTQLVLLKGVQLTSSNLSDIISFIEDQFHELEADIALVAARALDKIEFQSVQNERIVGGLFDMPEPEKFFSKVPMVTADTNFVTMLRYSMLAMSLLPDNCLSHILVITDGIVAIPDSNLMESLLFQMHYDSVAVSFLKVGSTFHPHSSAGYISYVDLLYFIASSTLGTCLENYCPKFNETSPSNKSINLYQDIFLVWSFCSRNKSATYSMCQDNNRCNSSNQTFCSHKPQALLSKRQTDESTSASLLLLVSRRMREGFTVDNINLINGNLEIKLSLQWKSFIFIHYKISSQWPIIKNYTRFEVFFTAPYEFLHDITCKDQKLLYRPQIIERFWARISQLSTGDLGLAQQISSFQFNKDWFTLPESVRSGIPVYLLNSDNAKLNLTSRDLAISKFVSMWQPISEMEPSHWPRWFHVHKLSLILKHDHPIPKHLHVSNISSKRFQCRQAATALYKMLAEWCTFILIDNHTYIRFLYDEKDKSPLFFCIVRVTAKFPCAVLNIGFATNTPGFVRYQICKNLRQELATLSYLSSPTKTNDNFCCILLHKPLGKIIVRYDRIPNNFMRVKLIQAPYSLMCISPSTNGPFSTSLSKYLYKKRWIWCTSHTPDIKLTQTAISRVLNIITRIRIAEGFSFAHHSSSGIILMVIELPMDCNTYCVVQYVLFPPFRVDATSSSSEEETGHPSLDGDSELQMITEVWIEPQYGRVNSQNPRLRYLNNKQYNEIAEEICRMDKEYIHSLLTMEHLSLLGQNHSPAHRMPRTFSTNEPTPTTDRRKNSFKRRHYRSTCIDSSPLIRDVKYPFYTPIFTAVESINFQFDPINVLYMCQRTKLLFSMFLEDKGEEVEEPLFDTKYSTPNSLLLDDILKHLTKLHNNEPHLKASECGKFTDMILTSEEDRERMIKHKQSFTLGESYNQIQWSCFIKGISPTHIILTFVPTTIEDVQTLVKIDALNNALFASKNNFDCYNALCLPIYVFDCSLSLIINAYISNELTASQGRDVQEDHRYSSDNKLKPDLSLDKDDDNIIKKHCNVLKSVHSKCFTLSTYKSLHSSDEIHDFDVRAAIRQCEKSVLDIDITDYILTVCGHVDPTKTPLKLEEQDDSCNELEPLHRMIQNKFVQIISKYFNQVPNNSEYFYLQKSLYSNLDDSDDFSSHAFGGSMDLTDTFETTDNPLFLQLTCALKLNNEPVSNTSITALPTCIRKLLEMFGQTNTTTMDKSTLRVSLEILCLTLPTNVQNIIPDYSREGLRTTSFCSDGFQHSMDTSVEANYADSSESLGETENFQMKSVSYLQNEIEWLLQDEIVTALLDASPVTTDTLKSVMSHVEIGNLLRPSCILRKIDLIFLDTKTTQGITEFVKELSKMELFRYKLCKVEDLYYLAKNPDAPSNGFHPEQVLIKRPMIDEIVQDSNFFKDEEDNGSENSLNLWSLYVEKDTSFEDSTIDDSSTCTPSYVDLASYDWLFQLSDKRSHLPNFWLIIKIEQHEVTIYFHCRFLELEGNQVSCYRKIQQTICDGIKSLCKKVNQLLLLEKLAATRSCDVLLEPDDNYKDWNNTSGNGSLHLPFPLPRNQSFYRSRSNENEDSHELETYKTHGYFSCPIVWQKEFNLNPRLKTGQTKWRISRGITALKSILEKFSVSNRDNMFVYRDQESNVFYLRLHENLHYPKKLRSNEFESVIVVRSPSIASLPTGQHKTNSILSEVNMASGVINDIRPRVRSFGEKDSKLDSIENAIILNVHGITEAGPDIKQDLIEVLQNRLDDAVLDCLSVMLSRNAHCPLTSSDVQFIQKPFQKPEFVFRFTIQDYTLQYIDAFIHYLKQNLLQFVNLPKYTTDTPSHCYFKDYSETDTNTRIGKDHIFIYNQSQHPLSGSRGIACITLSLVHNSNNISSVDLNEYFQNVFVKGLYFNAVESLLITGKNNIPDNYFVFRIWKQGRVNIDNLFDKLKAAVSQSTWDIVTEYYLLKAPLCQEYYPKQPSSDLININSNQIDLSKKIDFNCILSLEAEPNVVKKIVTASLKRKNDSDFVPPRKRNRRVTIPVSKVRKSISFTNLEVDKKKHKSKSVTPTVISGLETGSEGKLSTVYASVLPNWLEFGNDIGAPAVQKHHINLVSRHFPEVIIREILALLQDSPKAFRSIPTQCLNGTDEDIFVPKLSSQSGYKYIIIERNIEEWRASVSRLQNEENCSSINPHRLKQSQKFVPGHSQTGFIPRQKILWILVDSDGITLFTYNWAKDNIDKLIGNFTNLKHWLSVRASFLNSVTSQKLGLFHNQALTRKSFMMESNPYANIIGEVEYMEQFSIDCVRRRLQPIHHLPATLEAFRDNFSIESYSKRDAVVQFIREIKNIKTMEKQSRDEMKKLHAMYQSRTTTATVPHILLLLQNSRILHYCHTPLLFLPRWRLKTAATRDHSLHPTQIYQTDSFVANDKDHWHKELCYGFYSDYRNYLQTLGFMPLQIDNPEQKDNSGWTKDKSSYNSTFYIQKTILGGILLFTVQFNEPFFSSKLYTIECSRLQNVNSRASINRFTLSFLDECDRVKIYMHLHSFTYDFHLRCVYNYIANNTGVNKVCERYHVHKFLDDFLKYYTKAPNFARNLVHTDTLTIDNLETEGKELYEYLRLNVDQYNFKVFEMVLSEGDQPEYILVQVTTTPQVSYKDSQDRHHTDDFDITLVVYNLCAPYSPSEKVLHLKYYLILTSKREIFPKSEIERKIGKFRTVSSTSRSLSVLEKVTSELECNLTKIDVSEGQADETSQSSVKETYTPEEVWNDSDEPYETQPSTSSPNIEIYQESVNYLGYYSSHEQLMQQIILDKAANIQKHIREMVSKGMVHCRTHLLWSRLISPQENALTYEEFIELKKLANLDHLCVLNPNLGPLLNQPLAWYQGLAKLLLVKYNEQHRIFISSDGNIQYYVVLHPSYFGAFMLLSIDLHTSRGDLYAVFREPRKRDEVDLYQKALLDGFVNCICFYIWSGMIMP